MATYSHSRVGCYETCPYQYKLKYIDKIKVEIPNTIEIFMGSLVHKILEKLYTDKKFKKRVSKASLLKFYKELWQKEYSEDILVVKDGLTAENYKKMGMSFISDYYNKYAPFDDMTILGIETQDMLTLPDGNQWHVRIDKLGCKGNIYFVCDYKTNARMKLQEEADSDRQLALYSLWVKDKFKDAEKVILKWHMLAFNKEITSERTEDELKKLQDEITAKIKQIETATKNNNFPRKQGNLCSYCLYKTQCPSFTHEIALEKKSIKEFKQDEGVKLVDEFADVKTKLSELEKQQDKLRTELIIYGKQFNVDAVFGSNMIASLKEYDKVILPEDKEELMKLIKAKGLYEDCSMVCYPRINSKVLRGELDFIKDKIEIVKDFMVKLKKRA